jgi:hypothetical protein
VVRMKKLYRFHTKIANLYDAFYAAKSTGAEVFSKTFLRGIEYESEYEKAFDVLAARIPGFTEYYEKNAVLVDAWTDIYTIDGQEYAVYGEGELSQDDDVIALRI